MSKEKINHPEYYGGKGNAYEAINVIEAWRLTFCLGNVVKYISKAGKKDDIIQDLKKAQWYLEREIQNLEKNKFHSGGFVSSEHQTQNGESIISKKDLANKSSEIRNVLDAINENKIECDRLKTQSENKNIDHETAEILANEFADKELNVVRSFLGKDYICGFKEGVQQYIKSLNKK